MKTRPFQTRAGAKLDFSELGFGSAPIDNLYRTVSEKDADATLDAAWKAGIRYYDTAPLYGLGLSETRLNRFLRDKDRASYLISTKVGRRLKVSRPEERTGIGKFFDTPVRRETYDYSYDGVMRSLEDSFERLGVDSVDILFAHDLDVYTHGSEAAADVRMNEFFDGGGFRALNEMRSQGVVKAIGAGINEWQAAEKLARRGDFDLFLLAGRYTLLEQEALDSFLPLCEEHGIGIVIGGVYNSGILATGPKEGAFYNYDVAPPDIMERARRLQAVCKRHGVSLAQAALSFPLAHPAVATVLVGAAAESEIDRSRDTLSATIPSALWNELKEEGLVRKDAPTPS